MLTGFIALPLFARAGLIALLALVVARFINWAIYNWAYHRRELGPWSPAVEGGVRTWRDHLPVWGWQLLRRESPRHGNGYWIRPLLIELLFPAFITWYYCFYVSGGALPAGVIVRGLAPEFHSQFLGHFVLFALLTVATFIDFDEQSIPDYVTVTGTVIGLAGATLVPAWLPFQFSVPLPVEMYANIPMPWPPWLSSSTGLYIGLTIVAVWGFALLDRRIITRRGTVKAVQYFFARMFRHRPLWLGVVAVTAGVLVGVSLAWTFAPLRWPYLLSSLFGLAFAGGVTWGVRISASAGLGVEALGFGDVTLMAMIGTYVGWQPSLLVFFLAPLIAILFVLIRWAVTGDAATPYGPYLCAAVVVVLVFWNSLWTEWAARFFATLGGNLILSVVVACVALMGAMLWIWRLIKEATGLAGH